MQSVIVLRHEMPTLRVTRSQRLRRQWRQVALCWGRQWQEEDGVEGEERKKGRVEWQGVGWQGYWGGDRVGFGEKGKSRQKGGVRRRKVHFEDEGKRKKERWAGKSRWTHQKSAAAECKGRRVCNGLCTAICPGPRNDREPPPALSFWSLNYCSNEHHYGTLL